MSDETDDWETYESGPFCPHWAYPSDCADPCTCGHTCREHYDRVCDVPGCTCEKFTDIPKA